MTNTKWLRHALLGSVALGVMATGAQADELSELKAQLEGLQNRVDQLEQQPAQTALPEGASFITLNRGSADFKMETDRATLQTDRPEERGFTIAVTPTADLPAPIAEVVVYGFVKGDVIYSIDNGTGDALSMSGLFDDASGAGGDDNHIRLHARQSRFGIRSRTDTAIGQIRTQIEVDFFGTLRAGNTPDPRLRHAYGEWDMTPNWTFLAGRTTRTAVLVPIGVPTVDFVGGAGTGGFGRAGQVRLTYHSGPISWAVAAEEPSLDASNTGMPDLSSYIQFDAPGGHQFIVTGTVADRSNQEVLLFGTGEDAVFFETDDDLGWAIQAGANINLADIATLSVGGLYGEHLGCTYINQSIGCGGALDTFHNPLLVVDDVVFNDFFGGGTAWAGQAGVSFAVTDTTSFNVQYGFARVENDIGTIDGYEPADHIDIHTVHANILWRPVQQMQLGWEVQWGKYETKGGDREIDLEEFELGIFDRGSQSEDVLRAQFGAWFFF